MARQMKDSGIEWIGEIPADWSADRLQWHLEEIKVQNSPVQSEQVLSLTIESGVIPYEEKGNQGNKAKENYKEYKLAYPDTLVVNSMNVIIGAVGISKYFGCVSPVYYVFRATEGTDLRYIYYLFTNVGFQKEMRKYAKGILEIRLRISASDMLKRIIPKPSYEEQCRISDFLDKKCAEIDATIKKTEATIEEYKKLKQSVITEAVTKGIRGDRPMKDSGVDWIGKFPAEWTFAELKMFCKVNNGKEIANEVDKETEGAISVYGSGGVFKYTDNYMFDGTTVMFGRKGTLGKPLYVTGKVWVVDTMYYLTYSPNLIPKFNYYQLWAFDWVPHITQTALPSIVASQIVACKFAIPSLQEQQEIIDFLDRKCAEIDTLIAKKTALLAEMESYKKSVIYEYVTGKKEVL